MTDRTHLTPVTITDYRGRRTTVYRNLARRTPSPRAVLPPRPVVAAAAPAPLTGTPLPDPTNRSDDDLQWFIARIPTDYATLDSREVVSREDGRAAASLAMDLIATEAMPRSAVLWLLTSGGADRPGPFALDMLRVGARLWSQRETDPGSEANWAHSLLAALRGMRYAEDPRIATEEELASTAAVASFVMRPPNGELVRTRMRPGGGIMSTLRNTHLAQLLRDRPHDLHRVTAYIQERGMHPTNKGNVNDLRKWLDTTEDTRALDDGWL